MYTVNEIFFPFLIYLPYVTFSLHTLSHFYHFSFHIKPNITFVFCIICKYNVPFTYIMLLPFTILNEGWSAIRHILNNHAKSVLIYFKTSKRK